MPFSAGVTSSSFRLNTTFDLEYFILNTGQDGSALNAGAAGVLTRGVKNESTGEHPLSLQSGELVEIRVGGSMYNNIGVSYIKRGASQFFGYRSNNSTIGDTAIYDVIPGETTTETPYTASSDQAPNMGESRDVSSGQNPGTAYFTPTSQTVRGGSGLSGNGTWPGIYWNFGTGSTYACGFNSFPAGSVRYCFNRFLGPALRSGYTWTQPGVTSFIGTTVGRGGSSGISYGGSRYSTETGTSQSVPGSSRSNRLKIVGIENTGDGGSPEINKININEVETGAGGTGLVQIRYSDVRPLLPKPGSAVYTHYNGHHVYTFNSPTTIKI